MAIFNSLVVFAVVFLLMAINIDSQSLAEPLMKRSLLSEGRITSFTLNDTLCCVAENCSSDGVPFCAVDDNLTTVWTLKPRATTAYLVIQLNASSLVSDISVILSPTSVIPSSIVVTASGTSITWTTYFNATCQPNDEYLRRTGSQYFSCQGPGQNLTVSAPEGLFSIRNGSNDWLWWETFNQFQLTIEATAVDYSKPNTSGSIEIADVQLYGWDEPRTGCNCHPAGVADVEKPCSNGECICRSTTTSNSKCIPGTTIIGPIYGPVSGGTLVGTTGNYLANVTNVTLGDDYDCTIFRNNDTQLGIKTSAGSNSDLQSSIPVRIYWERPQGVVSLIIANWEFTYRPDPIIDSISPLTSIISGGIPLTVTGKNLDSVAYPFITLVIEGSVSGPYFANFSNSQLERNDTFCHPINSTRLKCITPGTKTYSLISNEKVTLIISMDIDRYDNYKICEITDGKCSFVRTYDPYPDQWYEDLQDPIIYNVYNGKEAFRVTGNNFEVGSSEKDYRLTVDGAQCEILDIVTNVISFYPPDPSNFATNDDAKPTILYVGYYSFTVGYIQYYLSWIDNPTNRNGLIIGLVCGVGGVVIIILAVVLYRTYLKAKTPPPSHVVHYSSDPTRYTRGPQREPTLLDCLSLEQKAKVEKFLVESSRIQLEDELGSGNFGQVYKGLFFKTDDEIESVAVKTIRKTTVVEFHDKVSFIEEATIMTDFSHRNVLSLIAVYIEDDFPYVVLPLMENGDLREFVSKTDKRLSVLDLTSYSLQVAEGMAYLAENKFIHRDLAARNCMINKDFVVKVADFGLARDIFENDYYRTKDTNRPLPVKWMAIECLSGEAKFTESSDVWSFGVLMWELFTRGRRPYADVDNHEMKKFLLKGRRLEQPRSTPTFIYDLMLDCWKETPTERPTFKEMVTCLREILFHAPEDNRASVASMEYDDETADVNQIRLHARRDGPVSYLDLTRDVPGSYFQPKQDDVGLSLEQTQDGPGSNYKPKQDDTGSDLAQAHDGPNSIPRLKQYIPGSYYEEKPGDAVSNPRLKQYDLGSNLEQSQYGPGSHSKQKQYISGSYYEQSQNGAGSKLEQTQDGAVKIRVSIPPDYV